MADNKLVAELITTDDIEKKKIEEAYDKDPIGVVWMQTKTNLNMLFIECSHWKHPYARLIDREIGRTIINIGKLVHKRKHMDTRTGEIHDPEAVKNLFNEDDQKKYIRPMTLPPTEKQLARRPPKVGRNEQCPCGSGKKFKKCCLFNQHQRKEQDGDG